MKKIFLNWLVLILNKLVRSTVNSTCIVGLGQPKEPKSLERYKIIKWFLETGNFYLPVIFSFLLLFYQFLYIFLTTCTKYKIFV